MSYIRLAFSSKDDTAAGAATSARPSETAGDKVNARVDLRRGFQNLFDARMRAVHDDYHPVGVLMASDVGTFSVAYFARIRSNLPDDSS